MWPKQDKDNKNDSRITSVTDQDSIIKVCLFYLTSSMLFLCQENVNYFQIDASSNFPIKILF